MKCNWALRHFLLGFPRFFKSRKLINVCCHVGWWSSHFKYQQMLNFSFICQQSCTRYLNYFVTLVDTCVRSPFNLNLNEQLRMFIDFTMTNQQLQQLSDFSVRVKWVRYRRLKTEGLASIDISTIYLYKLLYTLTIFYVYDLHLIFLTFFKNLLHLFCLFLWHECKVWL